MARFKRGDCVWASGETISDPCDDAPRYGVVTGVYRDGERQMYRVKVCGFTFSQAESELRLAKGKTDE